MPPPGSGLRPRVAGGCSRAFEGRGVHGRGDPLSGVWTEPRRMGAAQISGGGERAPARMREDGTLASDRRGGAREVDPRTTAGDPSSSAGAGGRLLRTPWRGWGAASGRGGWRARPSRGAGRGWREQGPRAAGAVCLGGSRRPWGRASAARGLRGLHVWDPVETRGEPHSGEGAPRLRGEAGWSEVPRAAWEGSTEGSAGSPGASAGRGRRPGFRGDPAPPPAAEAEVGGGRGAGAPGERLVPE